MLCARDPPYKMKRSEHHLELTRVDVIIMLAERKVKIKWSTDPRNTHWTNGILILYARVDSKYILSFYWCRNLKVL